MKHTINMKQGTLVATVHIQPDGSKVPLLKLIPNFPPMPITIMPTAEEAGLISQALELVCEECQGDSPRELARAETAALSEWIA